MINLVYISQNNHGKMCGFPLLPVLFDVANRVSRIIFTEKDSLRNKDLMQIQNMKFWQHHQQTFMNLCQKYFFNNAYLAFNEYVYHFLLTFLTAWRGGLERMRENFTWNKELYNQRSQKLEQIKKGTINKTALQINEELQVYLYKNLVCKQVEEENKPNSSEINDYLEILNEVEIFVFYNISELIELRV